MATKSSQRKLEYNREYHRTHKEQMRAWAKARQQQLKLEVFTHYSGGHPRCVHCGITDIDVLCLDHIEGGGYQHRKELSSRSSKAFYHWVKDNDYPQGFQVLCANCNMKKKTTTGK